MGSPRSAAEFPQGADEEHYAAHRERKPKHARHKAGCAQRMNVPGLEAVHRPGAVNDPEREREEHGAGREIGARAPRAGQPRVLHYSAVIVSQLIPNSLGWTTASPRVTRAHASDMMTGIAFVRASSPYAGSNTAPRWSA